MAEDSSDHNLLRSDNTADDVTSAGWFVTVVEATQTTLLHGVEV